MGFIGRVPWLLPSGGETTLQGKICIGPIIFGGLYVFISEAGFPGLVGLAGFGF
jgi:hypothetical protein